MRLEPLCRVSMRYVEGAWVRPFGAAEGAGFGWGEGTVSAEVLHGSLRWANYPRGREDGVWTPNLRGVITAEGGAEILISLHGQSVQEATSGGVRRAILNSGGAPERAPELTVWLPAHWLRKRSVEFGSGRRTRKKDVEPGVPLPHRPRNSLTT